MSDGFALCVAADTRSVSTLHGPDAAPAEKLRIIGNGDAQYVVSIVGEAEIGGEKTLDLVSRRPELLASVEGLLELTEIIAKAWQDDVESYEWENEDDQSEYLKAATLRIFIAQGPASAYLIQGSCYGVELMECDLVKGPLPLGTTSNIADVLGSVPTSRDRWGEFLSTIFTAAQQKSIYVAEPIDLIIWKGVSLSSIHRSSIGELEEICQTLLTPISNLNPDD